MYSLCFFWSTLLTAKRMFNFIDRAITLMIQRCWGEVAESHVQFLGALTIRPLRVWARTFTIANVFTGDCVNGELKRLPGPNFKINLILSKIADIFLRYRYCDVIWQTFPSRHLFDQIINTELPHPVKVELPTSRYAHVRLCSDKGNWNVDNRIETNHHSFTSKNMSCKYVKWLL